MGLHVPSCKHASVRVGTFTGCSSAGPELVVEEAGSLARPVRDSEVRGGGGGEGGLVAFCSSHCS